ncbi:MAG: glycosyltransferase [Burkholderiales bacterium]|nr:glycosyltransferase [Flavobacterium sp.]
MHKIGIITINYNQKEGLRKTIESILNQTFSDFEYIVIDGNSTDGSKEIVEQHKHNITYAVSESDTGIYNAMNKGILASNAEYLLFLNSGDCFYQNDTLAKAVELMTGDYGIYYGNLICLNKKRKRMEEWTFPKKLTLGFFVQNSLPHQGSFIKKELFSSISLYNENLKVASDWEFFIIAICVKMVSYKHIGIIISEYDFSGISSDPKNFQLVHSEKQYALNYYFAAVIDDYRLIKELESKRIKNILYLKQFRIPWKLLKGFSNFLLWFLPKPNHASK